MSQRERIPDSTKRIVRQEAFFGCVKCGNPIVEYAHIISYNISKDNSLGNLVTLCPTDHTKYDLGAYTEEEIREFKSNPFNKGRDIKDSFTITGSDPIIEAGTNLCINTPVLLMVDNKNIVTLIKEKDMLTLNALFYNRNNELVAFIKNNEWVSLSGRAWDIVYRTVAKNLTIRTQQRDIMLRLKISQGVVHFSGKLYYNGFRVVISPTQMMVGRNAMFLRHCAFKNCITAVVVDTQKGGIGVGSSQHEHEYKDPIMVYLRKEMSAVYKKYYVLKECKFCRKIQL